MKDTIYQYRVIVDAKAVGGRGTIFLAEINTYKVNKETAKSYICMNDEYNVLYENEGWQKHSNPGKQLFKKSDIDAFHVSSFAAERLILNLYYTSFDEYDADEIVAKTKAYLKDYFQKVLDNKVD